MGPLGVVDDIELVHLRLQFLKRFGEGLFVEVAEQGLVEPFVLALRGRFVGFAGDRFHSESGDIGDELADNTASGWVQSTPVTAQQPLRNTMRFDAFPHHSQGSFSGFTPGNVGGDREAGVVVDELEDDAFLSAAEDIFGRVELPARVRRRIDKPPV